MAAKKPLVLGTNGEPEQLQSGDTLLAPVSEVDIMTKTASGAIAIRDAVYVTSGGNVSKAKADASGTRIVLGFATAAISDTASGSIQTDGILSGFSSLTPGARLFLSQATAGAIVEDVSGYTTGWICPVGVALSATEIEINIAIPIKL